ncbi:sensor histidine kinase [Chitinimonas sp.]|uniref:sensor histidine kinase n=1 Tax=Chitinimonas sp. TaxID=1934313 RepID=UPI0035B33A52
MVNTSNIRADRAGILRVCGQLLLRHGYESWYSLLWLGFLFLPPVLPGDGNWLPASPFSLHATLLAIALFVPLHWFRLYRRGPLLWASQALIFVLGCWLLPHNAMAYTLWLYAGLPNLRSSIREGAVGMALVAIAAFVFAQFYYLPGAYLGVFDGLLCGIGCALLGQQSAQQHRAKLAEKDQKLAQKDIEIAQLAKQAERERIARDLHDLLGHTLSLISLKAELASKLGAHDATRASREMTEVATVARSALAEVRQAIAGMRALSLADALRRSEATLRAAGLHTRLDMAEVPPLQTEHEHAMAQAAIEACTNIIRHADASSASLRLVQQGDTLALTISDNGRGMGQQLPGHGLQGMRERLESVGGSLTISEAAGMVLTACVPLHIRS